MKVSRAEGLSRVLRNPDWWREKVRKAPPLAWPQQEVRDTLLRAMIDNSKYHEGGTWNILSARQTMKNEVEGEIEALTLYGFSKKGGIYVRTAPSDDQIVTSRMRLRDVLDACPVCDAYGGYKQIAGNFTIVPWGRARLRFISTDPTARVVGATASIALSNDEFHEVDPENYRVRVEQFNSSTNAPVFNWGVAADGDDLLQESRDYNAEHHPKRNLIYPADVWAEIWPNTYGKTWEDRLRRYGRDNPAVVMNYLLEPVAAVASFIGKYLDSFLAGRYDREPAPTKWRHTAILVDVAGEEDMDSDDVVEAILSGSHHLDSTAVLVVDVEQVQGRLLPVCRVVDLRVWVGKNWEDQTSELTQLIELWQPKSVVIDARGIGQQIAKQLRRRFSGRVLAYAADSISVDEDMNELYAYLHNGAVTMFSNDNSAEYQEAVSQLKAARRVVKGTKLKVAKDKTTSRIDIAKALTYLPRAVARMANTEAKTGGKPPAGKKVPKSRDVIKNF